MVALSHVCETERSVLFVLVHWRGNPILEESEAEPGEVTDAAW